MPIDTHILCLAETNKHTNKQQQPNHLILNQEVIFYYINHVHNHLPLNSFYKYVPLLSVLHVIQYFEYFFLNFEMHMENIYSSVLPYFC